MADVQQTYRFKFEFDRKDVKKQLNSISLDVKDIVAQIGDASDKVTIFKGLVSYLSDVNKALVTFKTKHKDDFASLFGNPDTDILNVLTTIFNTTQQSAQAFVTLKDKISAAESGKADLQSLRGIAEEINALFVAIGQVPRIDIDKMFSGKGSKAKGTDFAGRIKLLNETLAEFGITYSGFQARLSGGFNFGSGAGVGDGFISEIQALIDHIDKKNQELIAAKERLDKTLEDFDNAKKNGVSDDYQIELTEESVRNLTLEYDNLQAELENADAASAGFYVTLTRLIEVSLKLKRAFKDVAANSALKDTFMNISAGSGSGDDTLYSRLSRYAHSKDPMNKDVQRILDRDDMQHNIDSNNYLIADLKTSNDINAVIQKRIELQDRLIAKLEQHSELYDKLMFTEDADEADLLDEQLYSIEKEVATLTGYANRIDGISVLLRGLGEEGERTDTVLQKLYETLGMETPDAFETRLKGLLAESRAAVDSLREAAKPETSGNTVPAGSSGGGSGSGSGDSSGGVITADVDFTSLENTIKTEAAALSDKLDSSTFKVELVKDQTKDIQGVISDILNAVQQISNHFHVDQNKTDVNNMKKNLVQLLDVVNKHNAGRKSNTDYQGQELSISVMSDGAFSVNYGEDGTVPWRNLAESLLGNLSKTLIADFHSHPLEELLAPGHPTFVSDSFSGSKGDIGAFGFSKKLGAQMAGMITGNVLKVLDLSSMSQDMMTRLKTELDKVEQQYVDGGAFDQYIGMKNGKQYYKLQSTLEGQHKVTEIFESMLRDALNNIGISYEDIDNKIFKKYNLTDDVQLTDIATQLVQLVAAADQSQQPLQRLSDIISAFGGDISSSKAKTLLEAYNKGEVKVSDVFNGLIPNANKHVSEEAIQSLLDINNAQQLSPIETLLTNISSILSNINKLVGSIETSVRPNNEQQLNNSIRDLLDLRSGVVNKGLNSGIASIYNDKDSTRYRYDDVESRASDAVDELLATVSNIKDGYISQDSNLAEAMLLIKNFKKAFTYVQDLGEQRELFTGGDTRGNYIDRNSGELVGSIHPGYEGTYENLYRALTDPNGVLNDTIQLLINMRDEAFVHPDDASETNLQTTLDHLSIAVNDLSSEIAKLNAELSGLKGGIIGATKEDISSSSTSAVAAGNAIDVSQDATNLDILLNKTKEIAGEIRGLAVEVSEMIASLSDPFKQDSDTTKTETAPLENLKSQILEVREAVELKTAAFEQERLVVSSVVDSEIASLQALENQLTEILARINLVDEGFGKINANAPNGQITDQSINHAGIDFNTIMTNITGVVDSMRDCLQRITDVFGSNMTSLGNTLGSVGTNGEFDIADEIEKLGNLKTILAEVKNAIASKTKAFVDEGNVVGQVVGKEIAALSKLSEIIDGIVPKVNSLVDGLKSLKNNGIDVKQPGVTGGTDNGQSEDNFEKSLRNQKASFNEYKNNLKDVEYLSEDLRAELDRLSVSLKEVTDKSGLKAFKQEFEALKQEIDIKKRSHEATGLGTIHSEERKLTNTFNALTFDQRDVVEASYKEAIEQLQRYEAQVKAGKKVELQAIREITEALLQKLEAQKQANKDAEKTQKKNAKFGDTAMINATAKYNQLSQTANGSFFADSKKVQTAFKEYDNAYQRLKNMQSDLNKKDNITKSDEAEFKAATTSCNDYAKALKQLIDNSMKLHGEKANQDAYMLGADFVDDVDGRKKVLSDFAKELYGVSLSSESFKKNYNEAVFEVANSDGTFTKMTARFTDARNEIVAMAGDTKKAVGLIGELWNQFKGKLKSIFTYLTASFSLHEVWNIIKQGVNHVREIDSALTELKKVTDETQKSYKRFLQTASKTAGEIGSTVSGFVNATADFARLGYNLQQSHDLAKAASVYKNVGDGITDISQASESIISTMKAFGIEANDAIGIVDRFNEVGNNFAISSTGIGEAMQRSASALFEAGNTIDESIALITGANSVVICATSL